MPTPDSGWVRLRPAAADDHGAFHFRAFRAHANTNESIAAFTLLALFGVLSAASPVWLNALSWVYVVARIAHMVCYYAGFQLSRSVAFGVSLVALFGMLVVGVTAGHHRSSDVI